LLHHLEGLQSLLWLFALLLGADDSTVCDHLGHTVYLLHLLEGLQSLLWLFALLSGRCMSGLAKALVCTFSCINCPYVAPRQLLSGPGGLTVAEFSLPLIALYVIASVSLLLHFSRDFKAALAAYKGLPRAMPRALLAIDTRSSCLRGNCS
jgi:hypothetical protein